MITRLRLRSISVDSRPAAIHALRSYLNICTPFTIETDINSTITVFQVGGARALDRPPLINAETVRGTTIERARDPLPNRDFSEPRKKLPPAFITSAQMALCVPDANGVAGDSTTAAIQVYLQGIRRKIPETIDPTSAELRPLLQTAIDDVGSCTSANFKNAFEVGRYGVPARNREARIKEFQGKIDRFLKAKQSSVTVAQTGTFDKQTRLGIAEFRRLNSSSGDEVDAPLAKLILALP
jgi:hypothetical protein